MRFCLDDGSRADGPGRDRIDIGWLRQVNAQRDGVDGPWLRRRRAAMFGECI